MHERSPKIPLRIMLIIMGLGGVVPAINEFTGGFLPDLIIRIIGIADMICLFLYVFLYISEQRD